MMVVLIVVLALGAVAGLVMRGKQHPAGTPVLVVCSLLAVLLAVGRIVGGLGGPSPHERLNSELEIARYVMASEFGRYLAQASAGTQALCVLSPHDAGNEAIQDGLEEGLAGQIPVEFTLLERDASDDLDAVSMSASKVAGMLNQHAGTDLLITMVDLPFDGGELAALLRKQKVRLAAARLISPAHAVPYARAGILAGAVAYQDNPANISEVKDGTPQEIFASQFVLVPGKN